MYANKLWQNFVSLHLSHHLTEKLLLQLRVSCTRLMSLEPSIHTCTCSFRKHSAHTSLYQIQYTTKNRYILKYRQKD